MEFWGLQPVSPPCTPHHVLSLLPWDPPRPADCCAAHTSQGRGQRRYRNVLEPSHRIQERCPNQASSNAEALCLEVTYRYCYHIFPSFTWLPRRYSGKQSACQCRRRKRHEFDPWVRRIPWSRKWQTAPVFLPGKSHGQRSLGGYSPWGCKESDMTEHTCAN